MKAVSDFDYAEVTFDKRAAVVDRDAYDDLLEGVEGGSYDDVIVLAHGWNNTAKEARSLYKGLAAQLRDVHDQEAGDLDLSGDVALIGLLWPSMKFAPNELVAGGASAVAAPVSDVALIAQLHHMRSTFEGADAEVAALQALVPQLEDSPSARDSFVDTIRDLLPRDVGEDPDDFPKQLTTTAGRDVLDRLSAPILPTGAAGASLAAAGVGGVGTIADVPHDDVGSAAGLSLGGIKAAAQRLLNLTTYYQMKARAGAVGTTTAGLLEEAPARRGDVRIHLVGHSFGGRLVTSCAFAADGWHPRSLTLLQAAFSHYGFAKHYTGSSNGFFRTMVTHSNVTGPVLITHSTKDQAVGLAYPLASRLAHQVASGLGDANDRFGGIGRNGAQKTPESTQLTLVPPGTSYALEAGTVYNLSADHTIMGHSDIVRPEVAHAIWSAVAASSR